MRNKRSPAAVPPRKASEPTRDPTREQIDFVRLKQGVTRARARLLLAVKPELLTPNWQADLRDLHAAELTSLEAMAVAERFDPLAPPRVAEAATDEPPPIPEPIDGPTAQTDVPPDARGLAPRE